MIFLIVWKTRVEEMKYLSEITEQEVACLEPTLSDIRCIFLTPNFKLKRPETKSL